MSASRPPTAPRDTPPEHGNFKRYYSLRPGVNESRLAHLPAGFFVGRRLLDVGCNAGELTLLVTRRHHPVFVEGLDIDGDLVRIAECHRRMILEGISAMREVLPLTWCRWETYFKNCVRFSQADILEYSPARPFDTVMCLSVSKWVHLNRGDEGLLRLFDALYAATAPRGVLIFEFQEWQSYKNSRGVSQTCKRNFDRISIRPEQFVEELGRRGWALVELFRHCGGGDSRLSRPVAVLRKIESS